MLLASLTLIIVIIIIALIFDFTNGFHDSANAISTVVSTKVLSPRRAVAFAAFFNFAAAFTFGVAVASTISQIIKLDFVATEIVPMIVMAALVGAISWNIMTWLLGLPTSSSHALIGGLMGAGIAAAGFAAVRWDTIGTVALFMVLSPIIGLCCGFLFMTAVIRLTRNANKTSAENYFKRLQLCSAAAFSFSHGTNDAQKTMGIIVPLLFSIGYFGATADPNHLPVPIWVILMAHAAIALGTLSGGWRIVKTMGYKITKLRPVHGRHTGQHHPRHLLINHGCRVDDGDQHGEMGRGEKHRLGMDPHHPHQCADRFCLVCRAQPDTMTVVLLPQKRADPGLIVPHQPVRS